MIRLAKRFGRFTSIFVFAAAFVILALWLQLLELAPIVCLVLAPVAILVFCASFSLLAGMLFVKAPPPSGRELSRSEAPLIWAIWDAFDPDTTGQRVLCIDEPLNASIFERKRWFGLFGRQTTMTIGLELLLLADERLLKTVIAHEVGHARHQHTTGATNLAEFLQTFDTLFEFADPETTIVGRLADLGVGAWLDRANGEQMRLSRKNELEADRVAAKLCGRDAAADSEVFMATVTKALQTEIYDPLEKELVSAIRAPEPPHERVLGKRISLVSEATQERFLPEAWAETVDEDASHPSFRQRFENIAPGTEPRPVRVGASAARTLLQPELLRTLQDEARKSWTDQIEEAVGIY